MDTTNTNIIPYTREYRLAFSRTVQKEYSLLQYDLRIYENGKETVDVLYQFTLLNSAMEHFDLMKFGPSAHLQGSTLPEIGTISIHKGIEQEGQDDPQKV